VVYILNLVPDLGPEGEAEAPEVEFDLGTGNLNYRDIASYVIDALAGQGVCS